MKYEWDTAKNRSNFAKHGLAFEDAERALTGPCVTFEDSRFDYGEERLITLGCSPDVWSSSLTRRSARRPGSSP